MLLEEGFGVFVGCVDSCLKFGQSNYFELLLQMHKM